MGFGQKNVKEGWLSGLCASLFAGQDDDTPVELAIAYPIARRHAPLHHTISFQTHTINLFAFYEKVSQPWRYDPSLEKRLRLIISRLEPDIVHCFGTEYPHTLALAKVMPDPKRLLIGIQGIMTWYAQAYDANLPRKVLQRQTFRDWLKRDSIKRQKEKFAQRGLFEIESIRMTENIAGRTDFDRAFAKHYNPNASYHIMNETLRPIFYEELTLSDEVAKRRIFMSQGDYPIKGLHYALLALPMIRERYPEAHIVIAGNDITRYGTLKERIKQSQYAKYLRKLLHDGRIQNHVQFLGELGPERMVDEYQKAGIFLCASTLENSPNSLGEAMILGTPCVTADVGGIPSIFWDQKDGILYKGYRNKEIEFYQLQEQKESNQGDGQDDGLDDGQDDAMYKQAVRIRDAIFAMWENEEQQLLYQEHARIHAKITHDPDSNAKALRDCYTSILQSLDDT
jgi:glycosyltransferase involved in cell wall biosynthesis